MEDLMRKERLLNHATEHVIQGQRPGIVPSITYRWKSNAGTKLYVTVGVDEYGVVNSIILNVGSSGTTIHNLANALGRVISIAIQKDKATALQIVQTLEDVSSEVVWMSQEDLGTAQSIPDILALILLRHIEIEANIDAMHSGEEEDEG